MANRNVNVTSDNLDTPNANMVSVPENKSVKGYVRRPQFNWVAVLLFCSLPGLMLVMLMWMLWIWADRTVSSYTASTGDLVLAWSFRATVIAAIPVILSAGITFLIVRLWTGVQHSRVIRLQNNQPIDVREILLYSNNTMRRQQLIDMGLKSYYNVEAKWAEASNFRNLGGVYSPTYTNSQPQPPAQLQFDDHDEADSPLHLPPDVGLDDLQIPPGHLGYGVGLDGKSITAPIGRAYHALRQGDTGSGKTTNLNAELVQIHQVAAQIPDQFEIYAGDFKGEFEATWGTSPLIVQGVRTQASEIADMLEESMLEIQRRYMRFTEASQSQHTLVRNIAEYAQATGIRIPWRLVYLDEINTLLGGSIPKRVRERVDAALKRGLQLGRGAGVFYECGAQYMTSDLFDREGSKQFVTRAYFGGWDVTAMNMVFLGKVNQSWGSLYSTLLDGTPGRGVYAGVGGAPIPFQGVNVSVPEILQSIDLLLPESQRTVDTSMYGWSGLGGTSGTDENVIGTGRTPFSMPVGSPPIDPQSEARSGRSNGQEDRSPSIRLLLATETNCQWFAAQILAKEGRLGKRATLLELFNVKSGKSDNWQVASAFYDQVVATKRIGTP